MPATRRCDPGFTLFEVAISLLIITVAILAVVAILPLGARGQEMARYQLLASAKAQELVNGFATPQLDLRDNDFERQAVLKVGVGQGRRIAQSLSNSQGALWHNITRFDLERLMVNSVEGNIPLPPQIARRLDSPDGEIQAVLDAGGQLYYSDPNPLAGLGTGRYISGEDVGVPEETQRLIWAVVTPAQQGALIWHPMAPSMKEIYPFPPRAISEPGGANYNFKLGYRYRNPRSPAVADPSDCWYELINDPSSRLGAIEPKETNRMYQSNNWEWFAYSDYLRSGEPRFEDPSALGPGIPGPHENLLASVADAPWTRNKRWSPWRAGLPEFRRLAYDHYPRIWHQLAAHKAEITLKSADAPYRINFRSVTEQIGDTEVTRWYDADGEAGGKLVQALPSAGTIRGIPAPADGLPLARGYRGTDIINEDHEVSPWKVINQVRQGLPSLERRVMYRTAALALWARVDGHRPLMNARPDYHTGIIPDAVVGDPNVIDRPGNLPTNRNPLLTVVPPPTDPRDIHPSQIFALSYLAHAAMMVTGYQPPFIDDRQTVDVSDDQNLILNDALLVNGNDNAFMESIPFKVLSEEEYLLWDPTHPDFSFDPALDPSQVRKALRPGATNTDRDWEDVDARGGDPVPVSWAEERAQRDITGNLITYRRHVGPPLNPFPPPYADRGAFDWTGERRYTTTEEKVSSIGWANRPTEIIDDDIVVRVTGYAAALADADTRWARNAHETMMRWAHAYLAEHPYDLVVPRMMNNQVMTDKALFTWDLFNDDGSARRDSSGNVRQPPNPSEPGDFTQDWAPFHPVTWGSQQIRFGASSAWPRAWSSQRDYRENGNWKRGNNPQLASGDPDALPKGYQWQAPYVKVKTDPPHSISDLLWNIKSAWGDTREMWTNSTGYGGDRVTIANYNDAYIGQIKYQMNLAQVNGKVYRTWYDIRRDDSSVTDGSGNGITGTWIDRGSPEYPERYALNRPFAPQDRMRMIIFWAVDWKSYEDAETAPSAPVDMFRIGRDLSGNSIASYGSNFNSFSGHPEERYLWLTPDRNTTYVRWQGSEQRDWGTHKTDRTYLRIAYHNNGNGPEPDNNVWGMLGSWGADRNGNHRLDRGSTPPTVRLKAIEVARYIYYDPVAWTQLRN